MSRWFKFVEKSLSDRDTKRAGRLFPWLRLEALEDRLAPATFNVTTLVDGLGVGSLRAAILMSNATAGPNIINLPLQGTYLLSLFGNFHDGTNGALQITNQSVAIDNTSGGPAIIDGGGVDRVVDIEGTIAGGVTFTGVTIEGGLAGGNSNRGSDPNGSSNDGGGIFSPQSNVTLNNSVVTNNHAGNEGGGIWTDTGNVTLNDSTLSGDTAASSGGGLYIRSAPISLTSSSVTGNVAGGSGGGIFVQNGSVSVTGSTIGDNGAGSSGGGLGTGAASAMTLTITGSTLSGNVAGSKGGGVYDAMTNSTAMVTSSTITDNSTGSDGGGLHLGFSATINGCTISGNRAGGSGGGIFSSGVAISNCTISDNTAGSVGGGVDGVNSSATLSNSTLSGNSANDGGGLVFYGPDLTISGCTITGNAAAKDVGGIEMNNTGGANFTMTNSTVSNNSAGTSEGGIALTLTFPVDLEPGFSSITNSSINNNKSGGSEAGIFDDADGARFTNVNIIGNQSGGSNGGADIKGNLTMTGCTISDNTSALNDAGVLTTGGTFSGCTINGNHAGGNNGGLDIEGNLTLGASTISGNTAAGSGGGGFVYVNYGSNSISNCTISGNSAVSDGGGLEVNSSGASGLTITGCTISGNHSGADGGGIFDETSGTSGLSLTNDTISRNTASVNGGGIAFEGSAADSVNFVTISGNAAANGGGAFQKSGTVNVHSTLIATNAANAAAGPDVNGIFMSLGHNLVGVADAASTSFVNGTMNDQVGSAASPKNPLLGPLQDNGGTTFTQALQPGSPAIAAGDNNAPPFTDQRGFPSPGSRQGAPSIGASEFQATAATGNTANGVYVENLYETLLDRIADAGAAGWATMLNDGANPSAVVLGLENSAEYRTAEVDGLYKTYLHRLADPSGLQNGLNLLNAGGTVEQLAEFLTSSPEYFQLHGDSNDAFLTALYYDALGRGGSPAEQAGFLQALNSGTMTRTQMAMIIFSSSEYQTDLVQSFYKADLGRTADPSGLGFWISQLQSGQTDEQVQAGILGSGEAFSNRS
jgi:hypothetical protein